MLTEIVIAPDATPQPDLSAQLELLSVVPDAVWRAVNGDTALARRVEASLLGRPHNLAPKFARSVPVDSNAGGIQRGLGIFDSLIVAMHGTTTPDLRSLAATAESMVSPLVLTIFGGRAAHRVEFAYVAAGEARRLDPCAVELELGRWGRSVGSVLADFNLGRLLGWMRSGRLVNSGVHDTLTDAEAARIHQIRPDLAHLPVEWFGSNVNVLDRLGLTDGLDGDQRQMLVVLHADGWYGTVHEMLEASRRL